MPKFSMNFEEILSCAFGDFEEQNEVFEHSTIIINYCIIINNVYYNCIINSYYSYYISNRGLLGECVKEEHLVVNGVASTSCLKSTLSNILFNFIFF